MQVLKIKIQKLKNNSGQIDGVKKNPRIQDDAKFQKLKKSLQDFPEMLELRELVVVPLDNDFIVVGGNMRLKALKELGEKEAVCKVLPTDFPAEKINEFIIKDNVSFGLWDGSELSEWDSELLNDWGYEVPDWELAKEAEAVEDNYEIPNEIKTDVVFGDLITFEKNGEELHRLICGDSTDSDTVGRLMNGEKADMCHTDPPYNIDYEGGSKKREKIANDKLEYFPQFLCDVYTTISTALKKGGAIYVWHASFETHNFIQQFLNAGFLFKSYIIWNKNNSTFGRSDYHWKHEPCIYGWLDGASHKWLGDRKQTTVWDIERPTRSDEHPTMKPIPLCSKPLENSSTIGDIILDVFFGSGSTMVAAHQLNRKCYGVELDEKYCQVIIDRMKKLDSELIVKINGTVYEKAATE